MLLSNINKTFHFKKNVCTYTSMLVSYQWYSNCVGQCLQIMSIICIIIYYQRDGNINIRYLLSAMDRNSSLGRICSLWETGRKRYRIVFLTLCEDILNVITCSLQNRICEGNMRDEREVTNVGVSHGRRQTTYIHMSKYSLTEADGRWKL